MRGTPGGVNAGPVKRRDGRVRRAKARPTVRRMPGGVISIPGIKLRRQRDEGCTTGTARRANTLRFFRDWCTGVKKPLPVRKRLFPHAKAGQSRSEVEKCFVFAAGGFGNEGLFQGGDDVFTRLAVHAQVVVPKEVQRGSIGGRCRPEGGIAVGVQPSVSGMAGGGKGSTPLSMARCRAARSPSLKVAWRKGMVSSSGIGIYTSQ